MKFDKYDFGKKLHKCRIDKKLSQTKCSEYAGISPKYLSDIERGIGFQSSKHLSIY